MPVRFPNESEDYRAARDALLEAEIGLRAQVEAVAAQRRALPDGGKIPQDYEFTDLDGQPVRLSELFEGHDTLALYSFMFAPEAKAPCPACTSLVDGWNGQLPQMQQRMGVALISSAEPEQLAALKAARGWHNVPFYSARNTSYQADYFGVDAKGNQRTFMNIFTRNSDDIRHFWGSEVERAELDGHPRHLDQIWPIWGLFDMTKKGREDFFPQVL